MMIQDKMEEFGHRLAFGLEPFEIRIFCGGLILISEELKI